MTNQTDDVDNIIKGFEGNKSEGVELNDSGDIDYSGNEVHVENDDGTPLYTVPEIDDTDVDDIEEEIADEIAETTDEVEETNGEVAEAEAILNMLSDKQKQKYYNKNGTLKSASEIIAMHLNLQKALGMPIEKRQDYLKSIGAVTEDTGTEETEDTGDTDTEEVDTDYGYDETQYQNDVAEEQAYFNKLASLEYSKLQESWGLPAQYDPEDEQCVKAWGLAQQYAQTTVDFTKQRMKPFEEIQKKPVIVSTIDAVLKKQKIDNVSAKELTQHFEGFTLDEWRAMNPTAREMMISDRAKAVAYDNIQKNKRVQMQKQKTSEKQMPPDVTPNAPTQMVEKKKSAELSPNQQRRYESLLKTHKQYLTDEEIKDLAKTYK